MSTDQDWLSWRTWLRDSFLNDKEKDTAFWFVIAVQVNCKYAPENFREQAWVELLKRGIKESELTLYYLSKNAPSPFKEEADKLIDRCLVNKKSLKKESQKLLKKHLANKPS